MQESLGTLKTVAQPDGGDGALSAPAVKGLAWLGNIPTALGLVKASTEEDLTKPTQNMIQLLYQSVSIRDLWHSLALEHSLWRLLWITSAFLPLTCVVGSVVGM